MQNFKKCISVLLAVVMLASIFAFSTSAGVPELDASASQNIAMALEVEHADGTAATTVEAGETITVKVYVTAKDAEARIAGGAITIFWNSDVYTFVSREFGPASIGEDSLYDVSNTSKAYTTTTSKMTTEEKAYGWNIAGNFQITNVAGTNNTNATLIKANAATPFLTVVLKVNDGVATGTKAPIGIPETSVAPNNNTRANYTYIQTYTAASSTVTHNKTKASYVLDTVATALEVGTAAAPEVALKFSDWKNQIRFDKTADGKYANTFDGRMLVSIDNLAAVIGGEVNLANIQAKIKEIGFLYAKNGAINADTALAQIKGGAATYSVATGGGYISTGFDGKDYVVAGIIHNIPDADKTTAVSGAVYAIYDSNGDGVDEYTVLVLNGGATFTFESLYTTYESSIPPRA